MTFYSDGSRKLTGNIWHLAYCTVVISYMHNFDVKTKRRDIAQPVPINFIFKNIFKWLKNFYNDTELCILIKKLLRFLFGKWFDRLWLCSYSVCCFFAFAFFSYSNMIENVFGKYWVLHLSLAFTKGNQVSYTTHKLSVFGVFLVSIFPHSD